MPTPNTFPPLVRLTDLQARAVYELLTTYCNVSAHPHDVDSFVYEFTGDKPTSEYRIQGDLGYGGKFRFPRMSVDFYPEDRTPARERMAEDVNKVLSGLKAEFEEQAAHAAAKAAGNPDAKA